MPVHDWTRVSAGTFHDFHCSWIPEIRNRLNTGVLPGDYYAQVEQVAGDVNPDVLTLRTRDGDAAGGTALAEAPPQVHYTASLEMDTYAKRARRLVIRHSSDDHVVGLLEIISPGNKGSRQHMEDFLDKAVAALEQGYHLLLVDLFPPGPGDPEGIHGAIWSALGDDSYSAPEDKPLTLAAYSAGTTVRSYVEPLAVRDFLKSMPLFLQRSHYVLVPLEETYQQAYRGMPRRWREVLENSAP